MLKNNEKRKTILTLLLTAALIIPAAVPYHAFADIAADVKEETVAAEELQGQDMKQNDELIDEAADGSGLNGEEDAVIDDGSELTGDMPELPDIIDGDSSAGSEESGTNTDAGEAEDPDSASDGQDADDALPQGDGDEEEAAAEIAVSDSSLKHITLDDMDIAFNNKVQASSFLDDSYRPSGLKTKGYKKKIRLTWTAAEASKVSGYYIIRKDLEGDGWTQVGDVSASVVKYDDTAASAANKEYKYVIVGYYVKNNGKIRVSHTADWASAMTTASSKNNVYEVTNAKPAITSAIMKGGSAKVKLSFPKKPASKTMRWSSADESIATVTAKGTIKGKKKGTVVITGKTHTGNTIEIKVKVVKPGTAKAMLTIMKSWLGYSRLNGNQEGIIDIYNSKDPLPVGYTMKYSDAWCDATVSAASIVAGCTELTGRECSVPRHITIFKKLGIWEENGRITPEPGDLIVYSWSKSSQPNNASASHIGIVEKVKDGKITCIEGNKGYGVVDRRVIPVGWGYIRGYARPKYSDSANSN